MIIAAGKYLKVSKFKFAEIRSVARNKLPLTCSGSRICADTGNFAFVKKRQCPQVEMNERKKGKLQ